LRVDIILYQDGTTCFLGSSRELFKIEKELFYKALCPMLSRLEVS